ncbi:DUF1351 domain-containing protein [Ligilactobacillus equi]|uniref:DUF1351 domain-containing protein n=1 Tax=Ligilactobacillus equi DPC 6820 TaxID=1392007 RepID=V7HTE7_9LACO|nr:DUF1351 domain-containing protein [Ligilactobacillus equi]ETA73479.1 hypothetical protein LEQ_1851 [Ligilactobacillus equi DPC 6820]
MKKIELTLPGGKVQINETKPLGFENYDQLLASTKEFAKRYKNLVIMEDTVKDGKSTKAEITKWIKAINSAKLEVKKAYYTPFENQAKELMAVLKVPEAELKEQLDLFEEKRKTSKLEEVKGWVSEVAEASGVDPEKVEIKPNWLNKGFNRKKAIPEIMVEVQVLQLIKSGCNLIEAEASRLGVNPLPYLRDFEDRYYMGAKPEDLIETMRNDASIKQEIEEEEKQRLEAQEALEKIQLKQVGPNEFVDHDGQIKHLKHEVTFTVKGNPEQVDNLANFIKTAQGLEVVSASKRKEVYEK